MLDWLVLLNQHIVNKYQLSERQVTLLADGHSRQKVDILTF